MYSKRSNNGAEMPERYYLEALKVVLLKGRREWLEVSAEAYQLKGHCHPP